MKLDEFPGIKTDVSLKGYSTFGVGGAAKYFYELNDVAELSGLIEAAHEDKVPFFILGGGSNVLFMDEGFSGLIVRMVASEVRVEDDVVVADGGAKWGAILKAVHEAGLGGIEEFSGLPGTIGGSVVGNAGCFGKEIKDVFVSAKIYDCETNEVRKVGPDYFNFKYRWSRAKETKVAILQVKLRLSGQASNQQSGQALDSKEARFDRQPPGLSGGSFFKNPSPEQPAGKLIDECGLKGLQIGGAQISEKHANFFMNVGGATSVDLLALCDRAKDEVRERFGIELEEEVVIVR